MHKTFDFAFTSRTLLSLLAGMIVGGAAWAGERTIVVPEKRALDAGDYGPGRYGRAIWMAEGYQYCVPCPQNKVEAGTLSCWMRPLRGAGFNLRLMDGSEGRRQLYIGGTESIKTADGYARTNGNLIVTSYGMINGQTRTMTHKLPLDFGRQYHHLLVTWNTNETRIYLDGAEIGAWHYKTIAPLDGATLDLNIGGSSVWYDDTLVLDRMLSAAEVADLYHSAKGWDCRDGTRLYLDFDGNYEGRSRITGNGNVVSLMYTMPAAGGAFTRDVSPEIAFTVANMTTEARKLVLHGTITDMLRQVVCEREMPITVKSGKTACVVFNLSFGRKGAFHGVFTLSDEDGAGIATNVIPFALTLAPDMSRCSSQDAASGYLLFGSRPPIASKWAGNSYGATWIDMEYAPDQWDFETLDMCVANARRTHREVHIHTAYPPRWRSAAPDATARDGKRLIYACYPPKRMEDWADFVRRLGERYKGKVFHYEFHSEAYYNQPEFGDANFYGTTEQFIELFNVMSRTLKAIDPKIQVVCPFFLGRSAWTSKVAKGTAGFADLYSFHSYVFSGRGTNWDERQPLLNLRNVLKAAGASDRACQTEVGVYQLHAIAYDEDGYPMNAEAFDKSGAWAKADPGRKRWGRNSFQDPYTAASRIIANYVQCLAGGCEYYLWWSANCPGSYSDLNAFPNTPSLPMVAYANIAGLLTGYTFTQRLQFSADTIKAYWFQRSGKPSMLVAWTDTEPGSAPIECDADCRVRVLDFQGNLLTNPPPYRRAESLLNLNLTPLPVFVEGLTGLTTNNQSVLAGALVKPSVFPGETQVWSVIVYNPLRHPVEGALTLNLPKYTKVMAPQAVTLPARSKQTVSIPVAVPPGTRGSQELAASFNSSDPLVDGYRIKARLDVRQNAAITPAPAGVAADGNLQEWGDAAAFPIRIDQDDQVVVGIPYTKAQGLVQYIGWTGTNDLSAAAAVARDGSNLWVAVRVWDNIVMNLIQSKGMDARLSYGGDCVEIFLDARPPNLQGLAELNNNTYHLLFVPPAGTNAPVSCLSKPWGAKLEGLVYGSQALADGYTVEVKIPMAALPGLYGGSVAKMGFDIQVDDKDEEQPSPTTARTVMVWAGAAGDSQNAAQWGSLYFRGKPAFTNAPR